jgi:hypothetical protein
MKKGTVDDDHKAGSSILLLQMHSFVYAINVLKCVTTEPMRALAVKRSQAWLREEPTEAIGIYFKKGTNRLLVRNVVIPSLWAVIARNMTARASVRMRQRSHLSFRNGV